ncbi:MAG: hypothetical protein LBM93_14615 [Oscillospiraceae bacterium]|jgi:hypothetical protein|nr:hypothetical protein [Oscillospiraceae bacterium]
MKKGILVSIVVFTVFIVSLSIFSVSAVSKTKTITKYTEYTLNYKPNSTTELDCYYDYGTISPWDDAYISAWIDVASNQTNNNYVEIDYSYGNSGANLALAGKGDLKREFLSSSNDYMTGYSYVKHNGSTNTAKLTITS